MSTVARVAIGMVVGGGIGWFGGLWYGFHVDTSDFPIYAAFTAPIGLAIGLAVGGLGGALI